MNKLRNTITNIAAAAAVLGAAVLEALGNVPEGAGWYVWGGAIVIAVIGYFTGKEEE